VLPALAPAIASGAALGFARAVGEFGSLVLLSGNIPLKTQVASVLIFGRIESDDVAGAAALSLVLLSISLAVVLAIRAAGRRGARDAR
jgi:sulfate transport system permease protein